MNKKQETHSRPNVRKARTNTKTHKARSSTTTCNAHTITTTPARRQEATTMRIDATSITTIAILTVMITMALLAACASEKPQLVGGDKDTHGCLPSAGYTWCDAKQQCIRPWEENCTTEQTTPTDGLPTDDLTGVQPDTDPSCTCPDGYVKDGDACNPRCYYSTPPCMMPSIMCSPSTTPPGPIVGNDRDAHGCIGSAGYSWCEAKRICLRPWEESCPDDGSPQ